jgi:hypothetical protein
MSAMSRRLPWVRWVIVCCLYLGGGIVAAAGISHPGLVNDRGGLIPLVRGTAHNPYARRVLAPALVRVIRALTPPSVRAAAERRGETIDVTAPGASSGNPEAEAHREKMVGNWDYAAAGAVLNVASFIAYLFCLRGLLSVLFHPPPLIADLFPLAALLSVPIFGEFSTLAYDYPQLAFFSLGLWWIAACRDRAFLILLPIGMLNKETTILLPVVYLVTRWGSMGRRRLLTNVGIQLVICAGMFVATAFVCRTHPGEVAENHIAETLRSIAQPANYFRFMRVAPSPLLPGGANVPMPVGWNLPAAAVLVAFIAPGWREAPQFVRRALPTVLAPLIVLTLFLGVWWELRDYLEATPLVLMALYAGARRIWELEPVSA